MNSKQLTNMKLISIIFFLLLSFWVNAQDFSSQWIDHYSYFSIKDLFLTEERVYAAADNAIFIYDLSTNTSEKFSTIQGLSGSDITTIYHSTIFNITAIGYQNGLLEFITPDQKVRTFVDIFNKATIPPDNKRINHFYEFENQLFIATDFGIVEFNLENIEFGDTFFIGNGGSQLKISETTVLDNTLFAATARGILSIALPNANLIDFNQWQTVNSGLFNGVLTISDKVLVRNNDGIFQLQDGVTNQVISFSGIKSAINVNNILTVSAGNSAIVYDQNFNETFTVVSTDQNPFSLSLASSDGKNIYLGTSERGLLQIPLSDVNQAANLSPLGPLHNDPFSVNAENNNAWVVYGKYNLFFNPFPKVRKGISRFNNGEWQNISKEDIMGFTSLTRVAINPNNQEQVFISSFSDGLLEVNENTVVAQYNPSNSNIDTFGMPGENVAWLNGSDFDQQGNLWFNNSRVDRPLNKLDLETNEVTAIDLSNILPDFSDGYTDTKIDIDGNIFFSGGTVGVIGYNPESEATISITEDNGLPSDYVTSLAFDRDNEMWIGTFLGLRIVADPSAGFTTGAVNAERIVIEDDEGVGQELLFDITITDIEVDGSNNKWVSTSSSGVFYFSPDGQETIVQYTTSNSPLPSNNVLDISVDDATGIVYFATEKGLIALKGTATGPEESLTKVKAFPNPVRPKYEGNVTIKGLTANANVKITDIEGNLVFEEISQGGSLQWDTRAFGKHKVASGVYLILVTDEEGSETTIFKLLVVR